MAIWCAAGAKTCVGWLQRMLYVGGDTDTIGAVAGSPSVDLCSHHKDLLCACRSCRAAGQIACPLLEPDDVMRSFQCLWNELD